MKDKLIEIFASVFDVPKEQINEDIEKSNFENWDSINHLMLMSEIETEFGLSFEPEEMEILNSFESILNLLKKKP